MTKNIDRQNVIEEVKRHNDIYDISRELVPNLRKVSSNVWQGSIRNEATPALTIYPVTQSWYHFAGDATPRGKNGGDVIDLVELIRQCTPAEAIQYLADRAGIVLKPLSPEEQACFDEEKRKSEEDVAILETLVRFFQKNNETAITYLENRGVQKDVTVEYRIGWSNNEQHLREGLKDYSEIAVNAVLANSLFFRDSLIIPIIQSNKVVSLYSRSDGRGDKKHLYLREHKKGIFNHDNAIATGGDRLYLAEAPIDALSLISNGIRNVVSFGGLQPSDEQRGWLNKLRDTQLITCFDNDSAVKENRGYIATKKFMALFPNAIMKELPLGDLNDFFRIHSASNFHDLQEKDWYTVLLEEIPKETEREKLPEILNNLLSALSIGKERSGAIFFIRHRVKKHLDLNDKDIYELEKLYKELTKENDDGSTAMLHGDDQSQSSMLLAMVDSMEDDFFLFHSEHKEPFVRLKIVNHFEIWPCKNEIFKRWLSMLFWQNFGKAINPTAVSAALNTIIGKALFEGDQFELENRVAFTNNNDDVLWYDMADNDCRAIRISRDGWEVDTNPPILFRRYAHQKGQIDPSPSGDPNLFLDFVNVSDEDTRLLILITLISCFIPNIPHVIFVICGGHGSAKTMFFRLLKAVVDPSSIVEPLMFSDNQQELIQNLSHHYLALFDNLSKLKEFHSDMLCRAVTGSGFSKRELYSNDEDVIYRFRRVVGINGINSVVWKSDLLERSIVITLNKIPSNKRKREEHLMEEFNKKLPIILGGIFNVLSKALAIYPSIDLKEAPRMADFAAYGCAIAEALGYSHQDFLRVYQKNLLVQTENFLQDDILAAAVIRLAETEDVWEGVMTELLTKLKYVVQGMGIAEPDKIRYFPKVPSTLSRKLKCLIPSLSETKVIVEQTGPRGWRIYKADKQEPEDDPFTNNPVKTSTQQSFLPKSSLNIIDA